MLRSLVTLPRGRLRIVLSLLLLSAFCLPALVASWSFYQYTKTSVTEEVESGLAQLAEHRAEQIRDWIAERLHDLGAISRLSTVQAALARAVDGRQVSLDSLWTIIERERRSAYGDRYHSITVCNLDGSRASPPGAGADLNPDALTAAAQGSPTISARSVATRSEEAVLEAFVPLSMSPDLSAVMVLVARFSPVPIYRLMGSTSSATSDQVHLVDSAGRILNLLGTEEYTQTEADIAPAPEDVSVYQDERGTNVVAVHRAIPGLGWTLMIERDHEAAFRRVIRLRNVLWILLAVIVVAGSVVAVAASNFAVSRLERRERELRTTHQQLITADRLASVGMMAASVAHEINNPLTTIKVLIHSLREHMTERDAHKNDLGIVLAEIDKIKAIILRVLQFARPRDPEFSSVRIEDTLTRIVALIRPQTQTKGLTLTESYEESAQPVWADASQIGQVFLNILLNAVDATPPRGDIRVSMAPGKDAMVAVTIWNSGPGLPSELEERIFEPFFSSKPTGTGLGLSIARTIIGKHRGTISAKGYGEDGTSFIISLRTSQQETAHASRPDR